MILFITRKYPPSIGGMQQMAYHLCQELQQQTDVRVIAWGGSQAALPVFLPAALGRSLLLGLGNNRPRLVHVADALLSPLALALRSILGVPATATAHGLDVTFANPLYQACIAACLPRLDRVICVSRATRGECVRRGVPADRTRVIPNGVAATEVPVSPTEARRRLEARWPQLAGADHLLLTVGRLVERKGVGRFVAEVLPGVASALPGVHYLVIGSGPQREMILAQAQGAGLAGKVHLHGGVDPETLALAYRAADLFVMPNRRVRGDMEGFGIVALEAGVAGLWVVASRVEGIADAVAEGVNGVLLEPDQPAIWIETIVRLLRDDAERQQVAARAALHVRQTFSWPGVAERYRQEFAALGGL